MGAVRALLLLAAAAAAAAAAPAPSLLGGACSRPLTIGAFKDFTGATMAVVIDWTNELMLCAGERSHHAQCALVGARDRPRRPVAHMQPTSWMALGLQACQWTTSRGRDSS